MASPDHAATVRAYLLSGGWTTSWVVDEAAPERGPQPSVHQVSNVPAIQALDALVADLERATRERDKARLETNLQMQDKLDAQSLLANICQAISIDRSDFDLSDTWRTVAQTILERLTEIVDTANRDFERAERAERQRDQATQALREIEAWTRKGKTEVERVTVNEPVGTSENIAAHWFAAIRSRARDVLANIEKDTT